MMNQDEFWQSLERLVFGSRVIIDRPKGSHHPRSWILFIHSIMAISMEPLPAMAAGLTSG